MGVAFFSSAALLGACIGFAACALISAVQAANSLVKARRKRSVHAQQAQQEKWIEELNESFAAARKEESK